MSQIFKNNIPAHILFEYLDIICDKTHSHYIFNNNAYKRGLLEDRAKNFYDSIIGYYHIAKKYYITRNMNYTKFCTILRQICKANSIKFTTTIIYDKSKYHTPYQIYF